MAVKKQAKGKSGDTHMGKSGAKKPSHTPGKAHNKCVYDVTAGHAQMPKLMKKTKSKGSSFNSKSRSC